MSDRFVMDFSGSWGKLGRAREHLETLNARVRRALEHQPYSITTELQGNGWWFARFHPRFPPPPFLGVVLGDVAHNLRSALDHAMWQMVMRNVAHGYRALSKRDEKRVQFPIYTDRLGFEGCKPVTFLTDRQVALVRRFQPYHGRERARYQPLAELHWLSNQDKHRVIHAAYVSLKGFDGARIHVKSNDAAGYLLESHGLIQPHDRLEAGTPFARLRFGGRGADPSVNVEADLPLYVAFGDERPIMLSTLEALCDYVALALQIIGLNAPR